jgi:hypothetical protein
MVTAAGTPQATAAGLAAHPVAPVGAPRWLSPDAPEDLVNGCRRPEPTNPIPGSTADRRSAP